MSNQAEIKAVKRLWATLRKNRAPKPAAKCPTCGGKLA